MKKNLVSALLVLSFALIACGGDTHTHDFSGDWHSDETEHWKECPDDNVKGQTAPHTWGSYVETTAPTATAEGIETRECSDCGKTDTRPIAKLIACNCDEDKKHFEPCNCAATEIDACKCEQENVLGIPISKAADVTEAAAIAVLDRIQNAWSDNYIDTVAMNYLKDNVDGVTILAGDTIILNNRIIEIGVNARRIDITNRLGDFYRDYINSLGMPPTQNYPATPVELSFGSVTMQGVGLTATEWADAQTAIVTKFNAAYNTDDDGKADRQFAYESVFRTGVTVALEKNPNSTDYNNYKKTERILYINVDKIGEVVDIDTIILAFMDGSSIIAKATPQYQPPESPFLPFAPLRLCVNSLANKSKGTLPIA